MKTFLGLAGTLCLLLGLASCALGGGGLAGIGSQTVGAILAGSGLAVLGLSVAIDELQELRKLMLSLSTRLSGHQPPKDQDTPYREI